MKYLPILPAAAAAAGIVSCDTEPKRPDYVNFVLINLDDAGNGDFSFSGALGYKTPNIDRLALEGMRYTNFYAAQPISGASPRRTAHGVLPQPHRLRPCAQSGLSLRHQRRGGDDRRSTQKTRLRHGDLRQMAPRRRREIPAPAARVRRVVRTTLFERYVALPSQMEIPRPADLRRQPDTGLQPRPDHAHHGLHRAERGVHPQEQGAPLLPLSGPLDAARAAGRLGQIQGQKRTGALRRRDDGAGLERRRGAPDARRAGAGAQYAGDLHLGQRSVDRLRQPCRIDRRPARSQGHDLQRRTPRAAYRPLERDDTRG